MLHATAKFSTGISAPKRPLAKRRIASFEKNDPVSLKKEDYPFPYPANSNMWKLQQNVRKLPVPTLDETKQRYLEALKPLVTDQEWEKTSDIVKDFMKGEGLRLQEDLIRLDKESPTSWLEGFWDSMYLELRDPLIINVNPFLLIREDAQKLQSSDPQVYRSARTVIGCLNFLKKIRANELEPDKERDEPLDMSQYRRLFGTARIPLIKRDKVITYSNSRHIIVQSHEQFYALDVINEKGDIIPEHMLIANLQAIKRDSSQNASTATRLGVLTTEERNQWASVRSELENHDEVNKKSLNIIDRGLFVLCLDETAPTNLTDLSRSMLHRDGNARWYDKFNVITYADGTTANLFEHSPIDGHTVLRLWTDVDADLSKRPGFNGNVANETNFTKLNWNVPKNVHAAIEKAQNTVNQLINKTETSVLKFDTYGKNFITSGKMSPDAVIQMAFQLAYYRLYGKAESTYESANTKRFLAGRTETVRSVSEESVKFSKDWQTMPSQFGDAQKLLDSLKVACDAHVKRMNLCKNGYGVDRHLFGLRHLANHKFQRYPKYQYPAIFTDPNYSTFGSNVLSTSNVSAPVFELFGFGPVIENGLGLAYNIHNNELIFNITSFTKQASKYSHSLKEVLNDFKKVLDAANPGASSGKQ